MKRYSEILKLLKDVHKQSEPDVQRLLDEAMDIIYDYEIQSKELARLTDQYETGKPVKMLDKGIYGCPACGRRVRENHLRCGWCGCKLAWKYRRTKTGGSR